MEGQNVWARYLRVADAALVPQYYKFDTADRKLDGITPLRIQSQQALTGSTDDRAHVSIVVIFTPQTQAHVRVYKAKHIIVSSGKVASWYSIKRSSM